MASIVLGSAGSLLGGAVGGPLGASIGAGFGRVIGASLDGALLGNGSLANVEGPRLANLAVQTSTYGRMIPLVYGTVRIAGNILWSRPIKELATTTTHSSGGGKGGAGVKQSSTAYSYTVTLAIAICEGPIDSIVRVWADALQLDMSQGVYRIYKGTEEQVPDSAIVAHEGMGKAPAYRGIAYIVIEDFPLGEFGNRIPNFTFEIKKKAQSNEIEGESLEDMIRSITLIPGAGEFVYDTQIQQKLYGMLVDGEWVQRGNRMPLNMHNAEGVANAVLAIDQLQETLPNVEWVSVVATWFGTSMDLGECQILPGIEYRLGATTNPDVWQVGDWHRGTAHQITLVDGVPRYGGTPDDGSVLRLIRDLKSRGYKVMFYPMFFMDVEGKPWRGHLTGSYSDIVSFFSKTNGYYDFIMHYANFLEGEVDAFCIGSELIGLTKVASDVGIYPAVNALVALAEDVKSVMGDGAKLTYAADWSEYHHTENGWYNLDLLWASPNIDMIGIDAYFPLTDSIQQNYDVEAVREGWESGEGYDWYYTDEARSIKAPLGTAYAWKNIEWWWKNSHVNPDGASTAWIPESKKIWFTEYGFPSVDGATNQPNVFYDPNTTESAYPRFSRGRIDFRAQRMGLMATELQWRDSEMIERMFIWTWDARPFPYWPDLTDVWSDGAVWKTGHWVQGKLGVSGLASIVGDICSRAGLETTDVDATRLSHLVEGCVISSQSPARNVIAQLMAGFLFDAVESDGILKFVPRGNNIARIIHEDELVPVQTSSDAQDILVVRRQQEIDLPQQVNVLYINRSSNYMQGNQFSTRQITTSKQIKTLNLPIVFSDQGAKVLADQLLYNSWIARTTYRFHISVSHLALEPTDVIAVEYAGDVQQMRISEILYSTQGIMRIDAIAEDASTYDVYLPPALSEARITPQAAVAETALTLLDLPAFPEDNLQQGVLRIAAAGLDQGWKGAVVYRSDDGGGEYGVQASVSSPAMMGSAVNALPAGKTAVMDEVNALEVVLIGEGELSNVSLLALLNGANALVLGGEVLQFQRAELIEPNKYRLSGFLRGRLGTEHAMSLHYPGEKCYFLGTQVPKIDLSLGLIGLPRIYKGVSVGGTLGSTAAQYFTYSGKALRPYSPVHVSAMRDESGNIHIRWVRRSRGNGEWRDYVDVPLNEVSEKYEVEILNGSSVKRMLTSNITELIYTASQQIADFGILQPEVDIRIYQLSAAIGRGYAAVASV